MKPKRNLVEALDIFFWAFCYSNKISYEKNNGCSTTVELLRAMEPDPLSIQTGRASFYLKDKVGGCSRHIKGDAASDR
jgi:hypothetical protein